MKRLHAAVVFVLSVFACLLLCGCDLLINSPWAGKQINNRPSVTYTVYVCGAVETEGYYKVDAGSTYFDAIGKAGLLQQSFLPNNSSKIVSANVKIVVSFEIDGKQYQSVNVNGDSVKYRLPIDGVTAEVVDKIASYIEANGVITNKRILQTVLGNDYQDNYFKFFVAESDYEAIS